MRKLLFALFVVAAVTAQGQEMSKVMEDRAREMVRVMGLNDREAWQKFIRENYTKALIDKPMQAKRQTSDDQGTGGSTSTTEGNIDGKANMYQMLHNDFGTGKISSLNIVGETLKMIVSGGNGMSGTFTLKFTKDKPWLIDSIGVEVGN